LSSAEAPEPTKQAQSATDAGPSAPTILDNRGRGKTEVESALRQAYAAAILAGDDERADQLRAMLRPLPVKLANVVRLKKV
jgi:hypothetical protein